MSPAFTNYIACLVAKLHNHDPAPTMHFGRELGENVHKAPEHKEPAATPEIKVEAPKPATPENKPYRPFAK